MGMEGVLLAESRLIINCVDRYAALPPRLSAYAYDRTDDIQLGKLAFYR